MSERGNVLVNTIEAVLNRARDLRSHKKYFHAYRAYRDALASTMTILFLRKMDMLDELDLGDARRLLSLAGVIGPESLEVLKELKNSGLSLSGKKAAFHPEQDDDLYTILCQVAGGPIEVQEE
jgi:hypothetical protein